MIILDTNVLSEFIRPSPNARVTSWVDGLDTDSVFITSMTSAELVSGVAVMPAGRRRTQLGILVARIVDVGFAGRVLPFDASAARRYAEVRSLRTSAGRPIGVSDAIIAATALSVDADRLVTRNTKDFMGVGLEIFNPWID